MGIGFITTGLIWPKVLKSEEIGIINFLLAYSAILAQFAGLGIGSVTNRLFPYFRNRETKHNGFLSLSLLFIFSGIILVSIYYFIFRQHIIQNNLGDSRLIPEFIDYLIPFTIATVAFIHLEHLTKVIYNVSLAAFSKELLFRVLNLLLILSLIFFKYDFRTFFILYFIVYCIPALILTISIIQTSEYNLKFNKSLFDKTLRNEILSVSFFGFLAGLGSIAIANVDKLMINNYLGLSATGIYSIAYLFGNVITMPSRALVKISTPVVAEALKKNDLPLVQKVFYKSSINQFIFGGGLFLLLWMNIDLLLSFLPSEYASGKYVVLFICLTGLVEMITGVKGIIIAVSKYYKYQSVLTVILLVLLVSTNLLLIPKFGITGAAIGSLLSMTLFNMLRIGLIYKKFRIHPFGRKTLYVIALVIMSLLIYYFLFSGISNPIMLAFLNVVLIILVFFIPMLYFKISPEFSTLIEEYYNKYIKSK